ncbi:hypothetical protein ABT112_23380 [Streptomyces sp. NPDC002055]|uniref:hypothetical protein n=1 Tax=Streptomyces sp. NPDC002055 TaxID=3154534 RepID=UPI00332AC21F
MTGTVHHFDRKVTIKNADTASLSYCADESKGYSKDLRTGKAKITPGRREQLCGLQHRPEEERRRRMADDPHRFPARGGGVPAMKRAAAVAGDSRRMW